MTLEAYLRSKYTPSFSSTSSSTNYGYAHGGHAKSSADYYEDYYAQYYEGGGVAAGACSNLCLPFEPGYSSKKDEEDIKEASRPDAAASRNGETVTESVDPNDDGSTVHFSHDLYWREYKSKEKTSYITLYSLTKGDRDDILFNIKKKDVISISPTEEWAVSDICYYDTRRSVTSSCTLFTIKNIHQPSEIHHLYSSEFFDFLKNQHVPDTNNRDLGSEWNNC